ncbi:hypothetical protein [Pseudaminobacter salicylatoxidans]|uniref:hypothetical protein n=1 Tax=Pseudaminobacter salicylatoxidans TaxID=93369 RepID=UPI001FCA74FB|nr:hypothetical protein [Pseudaminobacter salicylatoxidans]
MREAAQTDEIHLWRDFLAAAELVRTMLGISLSAGRRPARPWARFRRHQRSDQISSAGDR